MKRIDLWWALVVVLVMSLLMPAGVMAEEAAETEDETEVSEFIFQNGDEDEAIVELKKQLTRLGFGNFPEGPSPRYGDVTNGVVSEFQEYYQIEYAELGYVDEATMAALGNILETSLQSGFENEDVYQLKLDLTKLGYGNFPARPSNKYGNVTSGVVRAFQEDQGLIVNGIVDPVTQGRINGLLNILPEVPYQFGHAGKEIVTLKLNLTELGFGNFPAEPSDRYGAVTESVVASFQSYYGLEVTGQADQVTLDMIESILTSVYTDGNSEPEIKELKLNLTILGFGNFPSDPSENYGRVTMGVVSDYQEANDLVVNGIADPVTLALISEQVEEATRPLEVPYKNGDAGAAIVELKKNLTELGFGNFPSEPSDRYGAVTESVVASFQSYYGLNASGEADQVTLDAIESILNSIYTDGNSEPEIKELKLNLTILGFGNFPSDPSENYGRVTMGVVSDYQAANDLVVNGIADPVTLALIAEQVEEATRPLEVPYKNGDAGEVIVELKKNLTELGFGNFPAEPSNRYGAVTESVVASFQSYYGLEVSGEADQMTLNLIESILNSVYTNGNEALEIKVLKMNLTLLGFGNFPEEPSERYGAVTMRVVREFQAANDLIVNGIADPVTLDFINKHLPEEEQSDEETDPVEENENGETPGDEQSDLEGDSPENEGGNNEESVEGDENSSNEESDIDQDLNDGDEISGKEDSQHGDESAEDKETQEESNSTPADGNSGNSPETEESNEENAGDKNETNDGEKDTTETSDEEDEEEADEDE
ncbi:peptidoglycan-binding protein [Salipaludibacillus sp. CUR1]|uniref:peptidoglycan-binding domain-containing protein n=1 Tax=Salipaludibacillus sp. CUR1 TaxID=2820003 RepID=UPI001E2D6802|nr:peptidoglycan-binding protein [Salipaludibacillus sp. CUR1]MCE7792387.1 peptidoglycan-binding protein [Salipaludibacillus sp. CUR1]